MYTVSQCTAGRILHRRRRLHFVERRLYSLSRQKHCVSATKRPLAVLQERRDAVLFWEKCFSWIVSLTSSA